MILPSNKITTEATVNSDSETDLPKRAVIISGSYSATDLPKMAIPIWVSTSKTGFPQEAIPFAIFQGLNLEQEELSSVPNEVKRLQFLVQKWIDASQMTTEVSTVESSTASFPAQVNVDFGVNLVNSLRKLFSHEDNWDGYGTPKISDALKKKCFEILSVICHTGFILPHAFPVVSGGLQFEWELGNNELEIEFSEETISALRTETLEGGRKRYTEDEKVTMDEIPELIAWLKNS